MRQWTGLPVGVGIGPTKTLAKLANHLAKRHRYRTGGPWAEGCPGLVRGGAVGPQAVEIDPTLSALWEIKDRIVREHDYDVERLAA